jgi:hypothetical protein
MALSTGASGADICRDDQEMPRQLRAAQMAPTGCRPGRQRENPATVRGNEAEEEKAARSRIELRLDLSSIMTKDEEIVWRETADSKDVQSAEMRSIWVTVARTQ